MSKKAKANVVGNHLLQGGDVSEPTFGDVRIHDRVCSMLAGNTLAHTNQPPTPDTISFEAQNSHCL